MDFSGPTSATSDGAFHLAWRRASHASLELAAADAVRVAANYLLAGCGLLALCRILFGGWSGSGHGPRSNVRRRIDQRLGERWERMTPEEREKFRQSWRSRCGFGPSTSESKEQ